VAHVQGKADSERTGGVEAVAEDPVLRCHVQDVAERALACWR
jgi:hypothetical protein